MASLKPYKVTNFKRTKRYGVVASSLAELKEIGCEKLKMSSKNIRVALADGTLISEETYFQTMLPNTVFVFLQSKEEIPSLSTVVSDLLSFTRQISGRTLLMKLLADDLKSNQSIIPLLHEALENAKCNLADSKEEDPTWFEGLHEKYNSKEDVLKENASRRIKSYLYKTKDDVNKIIQNEDASIKNILEKVFFNMLSHLRKNQFHEGYFARTNSTFRLCDKEGWFVCAGQFNANECSSNHTTNPYGNRESRISLKTWNFDHVIERSRTVIPALLEATKQAAKQQKSINWKYFYKLLFCANFNLKFVHHVCHIVESHNDYQCDSKMFLT